MFGSTILEVVIGLVFVFLLYSLLATILQELVGTWLHLRGRVLRKAIERMLNDGYVRDRGKDASWRWTDLFFWKAKEYKNSMADKFYDHPSIKYLSKHKRPPSYISAENYTETLCSLIREKGIGETDMEKIGFALRFNTLCFEVETLKQVRDIYQGAEDDVNLFKKKLNAWYDQTMDRATGWYMRKLKVILFIIGFVIAVVFNVDCIRIVKVLSKDETARTQLVQMGIAATDTTTAIGKFAKKNPNSGIDTAAYHEVRKAIDESQQLLGGGWGKGDNLGTVLLHGIAFWEPPFWGFLLTALAISLGAKFWFDLLNKLVAIRNAGVKPEEKEEKKTPDTAVTLETQKKTTAPPVLPPALNQVEDTVRIHGPELKKIAGVMSVFAVNKGATGRVMQVNVADANTKTTVDNWLSALKLSNPGLSILTSVVVTGVPSKHDAVVDVPKEGQIANQEMKSFGSMSCVLQDATQAKHILSCWHVLKGNLNYSEGDNKPNIIDYKSNLIAERWCGGIGGAFDYGIAKCVAATAQPSNALIKSMLNIPAQTKLTFRPVLSDDANKQTPVKFFNCLTQSMTTGVIYATCDSVTINYQDIARNVLDVLVLCNATGTGAISTEGNSGAMIFDPSGTALGIIIGGDTQYSYAIRLSNIFNIHKDLTIAN